MTKKIPTGIYYVLGGVAIFFSRYIPILHYEQGFLERWFSIDQASNLCNTTLGYFAEQCNWVQPLNIVVIVASALLIAYGIYSIQQTKKT